VDDFAERKLVSYLELSLRRFASTYRIRLARRLEHEVAVLNQPVNQDEPGGTEQIELLSGAPAAEEEYLVQAPVEEVLDDPFLYQAYLNLSPRQREILLLLVLGERRQAELAFRWNVTQQAICKSKRQAVSILCTAAAHSQNRFHN